MSVVSGLYDYLIAETAITDQLATYDFGGGSIPAIFTSPDVPEDAATPFILITPAGGYLSGRDRADKGGVVTCYINLWGSKGDSEKTLRELADTMWFAIDRASISVTGMEVVYCLADPPRRLNDSGRFPGFNVYCRVLVRKQ